MRLTWQIAIIWFGLFVLQGCEDKTPVDSSQAMARVEAALQINNPTQRDEALVSASRDAAKAGAVDVVRKGITAIGNPTSRDEVARDCALKLRDLGQTTVATDIAKLIANPTMRDEVLKKLASGS